MNMPELPTPLPLQLLSRPPAEFTVIREGDALVIETSSLCAADDAWIDRNRWLRRFPARQLIVRWSEPGDPAPLERAFIPSLPPLISPPSAATA
jgi:hypothetical protein